jgi:mannan endo-1,4-beta-mannosidase
MTFLSFLPALLALGNVVSAANSFAGSNLYYAAGLSSSERATLFG